MPTRRTYGLITGMCSVFLTTMSDADARTVREEWGSRFGFLMAMLGAMVGAGNIWRMPYVTGQNGGGAFLLAYVVLLFEIGRASCRERVFRAV